MECRFYRKIFFYCKLSGLLKRRLMPQGTVFFCQNCGYETPKWMGQCPGCGEWNTLVEETVVTKAGSKSGRSVRISDNKVSYLFAPNCSTVIPQSQI